MEPAPGTPPRQQGRDHPLVDGDDAGNGDPGAGDTRAGPHEGSPVPSSPARRPSDRIAVRRSSRHASNEAVRASGRGITTQSNPLRTLVPTLRATSRHRRLTRLRSTAPPIFLETANPNLGGPPSPRSRTRIEAVRPRTPRPCRSTRSNSAGFLSVPGARPRRSPDPTLTAWPDLSGGDGRSPLSRSAFASAPETRGSSAEPASSAGTSASSVAWLLLRPTGLGAWRTPGAGPGAPEASATSDRSRTESGDYIPAAGSALPVRRASASGSRRRAAPNGSPRRPERPDGTLCPARGDRIRMSPLRGSPPVAIITAVRSPRARADPDRPRKTAECCPTSSPGARPATSTRVKFFPTTEEPGTRA